MNEDELNRTVAEAQQRITSILPTINDMVEHNQRRVLTAFQHHRVSEMHMHGSTGYGYNDRGRETLDAVFADLCGAQAALVRPHIASGTHAIAAALFGVLRPGDEIVFLTGEPYDTLLPVLGHVGDGRGSLRDWGVHVTCIPLSPQGEISWDIAEVAMTKRVKVVAIQRSRGYNWRPAFSLDTIRDIVSWVKQRSASAVTFVDNCYGEWVEMVEPTHPSVGVDLMAGSFIKNVGGGLAPTGGYVAGRQDLVQHAAARLIAPGVGQEIGSYVGGLRLFYQGLFMGPHVVGQALQGAVFCAALMEQLGFTVSPRWDARRTDIIQAIAFAHERALISFIQAIQQASPIDAHATPIPAAMPGYADAVIMAAGTFVQGSSIELSADAPLRPPYIAYVQGGLTYAHVKWAVVAAAKRLLCEGYL